MKRLGHLADPWSIMGATYVFAAIFLWLAVLLQHQPVVFLSAVLWPSLVYGTAFALYTLALSQGEISEVSLWTNLTTILLFLWNPLALAQGWWWMGLFAVGAWLSGAQRVSENVAIIIGSDVFFAMGRLLDVHYQLYPPLTYGANLMTGVGMWMILGLGLARWWPKTIQTVRTFPAGFGLEGFLNALSYVSVVILLRQMPAVIVEAISASAGLLAAFSGFFFHEPMGFRRVVGASVMSFSAILLLLAHTPASAGMK